MSLSYNDINNIAITLNDVLKKVKTEIDIILPV